MKIEIPCPNCGCQIYNATTVDGVKRKILVCECKECPEVFEVIINDENNNTINSERHNEISILEASLTSKFKIDPNSITHNCVNND